MARDLPSGMIACRIDGVEARVAAISPGAVDLRAAEKLRCARALELSFYRPESGDYLQIPAENVQAGPAWREDGATLTRLFFADAKLAAAVRRALNDFARFVELRGEWGASAYGAHLNGYPVAAEADFPASPEAQWDAWFSEMPPLPDAAGVEIALALNAPALWRAYLDVPLDEMMDAYARLRRIPRAPLPASARRLYLGNPGCAQLFPDARELKAILDKAAREGAKITLVTAELRMGGEARLDAIFEIAARFGAECEIDDWGALYRAQGLRDRPALLLGPRLNRRRKDSRLQWKAGAARAAALLAENDLNRPAWRARLERWGIARVECELAGRFSPPAGPRSLHLPFYASNLSLWCPLRALCERKDRGAQSGGKNCPRWCARNELLYPDWMRARGRFNAILGFDGDFWPADFMRAFDRWVLNF